MKRITLIEVSRKNDRSEQMLQKKDPFDGLTGMLSFSILVSRDWTLDVLDKSDGFKSIGRPFCLCINCSDRSKASALTPWKKHKGDVLISGDTFSTFVRSARRPIKCSTSRLKCISNIQTSPMIRFFSGLLLHAIGCVITALVILLLGS